MSKLFGGALLGLCMLLPAPQILAQDSVTTEAAPAAKPRAKKAGGNASGKRLPRYYADVVDGSQRQQIYKVQEQYAARIAAAQAELKKLTGERDAAIKAVLRPEQVEIVERKQAEAEANAKTKKTATTSAAPATTTTAP